MARPKRLKPAAMTRRSVLYRFVCRHRDEQMTLNELRSRLLEEEPEFFPTEAWKIEEIKEKAYEQWQNRYLLKELKKIPKKDADGRSIELVCVLVKKPDDPDGGTEPALVPKQLMTYDQTAQKIREYMTRGESNHAEARRLYDEFLIRASKADARRMRGEFQRVFEWMAVPRNGD